MDSPEVHGLSQIMFEESLDTNLQQVAALAVRNVTGADFAGITLLRDGQPTTAVFTDPASPQIDAAQYEEGEGPCLDAFRQNTMLTRRCLRHPREAVATREPQAPRRRRGNRPERRHRSERHFSRPAVDRTSTERLPKRPGRGTVRWCRDCSALASARIVAVTVPV